VSHPTALRRSPLFAVSLAFALLATLLAAPADARGGPPPHAAVAGNHEVWMLDQGTDLIHVHESRRLREVAAIDVSPAALRDAGFAAAPTGPATVPHMIEFDSKDRYAFIASTGGAVTIVIDARRKQVVEVLATGAGSHMAAVTPDDSAVWVAAIGAEEMVEIPLDLDARRPTFAIERRLPVGELLAEAEEDGGWKFPSYSPVCHQFSPDSKEAWVTLGPGWDQGGLFVLDLAEGQVTAAWDPSEVKANCGISVTEDRAVANWSGKVLEGEDTNGEWYIFDRHDKELLDTRDAEGLDAHAVRLTPDGSEYWMVNRLSSNAIVVRADDFKVTRRIDDVADTPDILDYSPDGSLVYITQRGPSPRSGAIHAAAGDEPGVAVVDTATGERSAFIAPPTVKDTDGVVLNDVHGIGVRRSVPGEQGLARAEQVRRPAVVPARFGPTRFGPANPRFHCSLPASA
jgi:DNA-binding beta-propeller fold protein YncE